MTPYVFHVAIDDAGGMTTLRECLTSDQHASIRSFELLRANPGWRVIVVSHMKVPVLRRVRSGGKLPVVWGLGFPRATEDLRRAQGGEGVQTVGERGLLRNAG